MMSPIIRAITLLVFCTALPVLSTAQETDKGSDKETKKKQTLLDVDFQDAPTYIKSNSLTLKTESRTFLYEGGVEMKQGDFILHCNTLEGKYDEDNVVQTLEALQNVVITKGTNIRATSEKAIYSKKSETVTLTENPELQQAQSVLTADLIRIFLEEDRSTAEGQVRVKLVDEKKKEGGEGLGRGRASFKEKREEKTFWLIPL